MKKKSQVLLLTTLICSECLILTTTAQETFQLPPIDAETPIEQPLSDPAPQINVDPFSLPSGIEQGTIEPNLQLTIKSVDFDGNTIFTDDEIREITDPYEGKQVLASDLEQIEIDIKKIYRDAGYLSSGALIELGKQIDPTQAEIYVQIIEGEVSSLEINGAKRLKGFVKNRLKPLLDKPLYQPKLYNRLKFLLDEDQIENLNVDVQSQQDLSRNTLVVNIVPARIFDRYLLLNNSRSPSIGTLEYGLSLIHRNVAGLGDTLLLNYRKTDGSSIISADYNIPLNAEGGSVGVSYLKGNSKNILDPFEPFDLESKIQRFAVAFQQPILRKSSNSSLQKLTLGIGARRSESKDTFDGFRFPLLRGANPEGITRSTVLNFFQNYERQTRTNTLVLNSDLSVGVDLGSINDPFFGNGDFVKWNGQGIFIQHFSDRLVSIFKASAQFSNRDLLSNEQDLVGGIRTVRGFPEGSFFSDNTILASHEMRYSLFQNNEHKLEVLSFFDLGYGYNNTSQLFQSNVTRASIGAGVNYYFRDHVIATFEYGLPVLGRDHRGESLQERGFSFRVQIRF